jgi:hypothetical protein
VTAGGGNKYKIPTVIGPITISISNINGAKLTAIILAMNNPNKKMNNELIIQNFKPLSFTNLL